MICPYFPEPAYFLFVPDLSLIYYAHFPVTILALLVGLFVYFSGRQFLINRLLFFILLAFVGWNIVNLIAWTNINGDFILFAWSLFGPLSALISVLSIYFIYVFLGNKDVTAWHKLAFLALMLPVFITAPTPLGMNGFNITDCDAFGFEGLAYEAYYTALGFLAMAWILILLVRAYRRAASGMKKQIVLMGTGIELFLFSFITTVFLASYLAGKGILTDSELEVYGLFGMMVFIVYIGILLVRFKTFHASLIASQALVVALLILIGSQFTFVTSETQQILVGITFFFTAVAGVVLIRSVKKEVEQRKHIEHLLGELEKANKQQVILLHFITHQIKGFVTKSRNIFSMLLEGDYGQLPEPMKPMVEEGLRSDTKGANTIQEILNAANIKSGKVTYTKQPLDLKALVTEILGELKPAADAKGLTLNLTSMNGDYTLTGDRMQLVNAIKNLIDNSIKYTPKGSVEVSLTRDTENLRMVVKDTGVGITPEDMKVLFTEGGHGKDSTKVNVDSTGFGLYIVRNIIETHHGRVWAESEGAGKGSSFIVELPAS